MIEKSFKHALLDFYFDEGSAQLFQGKLYENVQVLEKRLGDGVLFQLLDINLSNRDGLEKAKQFLRLHYSSDPKKLYLDRALLICERYFDGVLDIEKAVSLLSILESQGCEFIPARFAGYESEIDDGVDFSHYEDRAKKDIQDLESNLKAEIGNVVEGNGLGYIF